MFALFFIRNVCNLHVEDNGILVEYASSLLRSIFNTAQLRFFVQHCYIGMFLYENLRFFANSSSQDIGIDSLQKKLVVWEI